MPSFRSLTLTALSLTVTAVLVGCGGSNLSFADENDAESDGATSEASADETSSDDGGIDSVTPDTKSDDTKSDDTKADDTRIEGADTAADSGSVDTSSPDTGLPPDAPACATTQKMCGGGCVSKTSIAYGCATSSCAPCPSDAHGDATCTSDGACSKICDFGYHLCGATCVAMGPSSCGASCTACTPPLNSAATCSAGTCGSACLEGFADCNGGTDGCERNLLTDSANCGACGHSCAGDACAAGMCVPKTLAVGQNDPSDLAVDGLDLFWSNHGANQIVKVAKVGGTATVFASSQPSPVGIALDDTHVYWAQNATPGAVVRAPKSGGSPQVIAASQYYAYRLVLSGANVYFVGDSTSGFLRSVPKVGGTVTDLQSASSPKGLAFDGTKLFWTAWNEIRKADPIALAPPTKLTTTESFPSAIAIDDSDVYWADMYASKVRKAPKTGGVPTTLASLSSGGQRGAIALDATYVYFIDPKSNTIRKVAKSGGSPTTIATASDPRGLTLDGTYLYWSNGGDGTIMRVAK